MRTEEEMKHSNEKQFGFQLANQLLEFVEFWFKVLERKNLQEESSFFFCKRTIFSARMMKLINPTPQKYKKCSQIDLSKRDDISCVNYRSSYIVIDEAFHINCMLYRCQPTSTEVNQSNSLCHRRLRLSPTLNIFIRCIRTKKRFERLFHGIDAT